jgi:hypothetical protein
MYVIKPTHYASCPVIGEVKRELNMSNPDKPLRGPLSKTPSSVMHLRIHLLFQNAGCLREAEQDTSPFLADIQKRFDGHPATIESVASYTLSPDSGLH